MACPAWGQKDKSRSNDLICIKLQIITRSFQSSAYANGFNVAEPKGSFCPNILDAEVPNKCTKQRHHFTITGNMALSALETSVCC